MTRDQQYVIDLPYYGRLGNGPLGKFLNLVEKISDKNIFKEKKKRLFDNSKIETIKVINANIPLVSCSRIIIVK